MRITSVSSRTQTVPHFCIVSVKIKSLLKLKLIPAPLKRRVVMVMNTKMVYQIGIIALILVLFLGFRSGYFVIDRFVFGFQINPIIRSGEIQTIQQYKIVHNYIEMKFEQDPNEFEKSPEIEKLNKMMVVFHEK